MITAGVFAATGEPNLIAVIAVAALGAFTGDHTSYLIGRTAGGRLLARTRPGTRRPAAFDWAGKALAERGGLILVVARYIPGGRTATTIAMGTVGYPLRADELAAALRARRREVIRVSVDDFHHPREVRYCRGRHSPAGFWLDSYDYARLRADVLDPLAPGDTRRYRRVAHDLISDTALTPPLEQGPPGAVLVLDGLFLHRDGLAHLWDLSVFLDVPFR